MLFSGLACFSPSVAPTIRKLWVKNGGTLTHTDADFKRANYLFCDGMEDPWLNELLSRCLIVRHASWVTLCVAEDFLMPIAAYTLDDGFDLTKIRIIEPPVQTRKATQADTAPIVDGALNNPIKVPVDILPKETKAISRKRPFNNDSSMHEEEQRPRKKARIDVHSLVFPELYDQRPSSKKPRPILSIFGDESAKPDIVPVPHHKFAIFPKNPSSRRAIGHRFLSRIRQTPANEISPLSPFSLFWNHLLETHLSEDGTTPLTLFVEDLLRAPRARATIFTVNTDYLGRKFTDSGLTTYSMAYKEN